MRDIVELVEGYDEKFFTGHVEGFCQKQPKRVLLVNKYRFE